MAQETLGSLADQLDKMQWGLMLSSYKPLFISMANAMRNAEIRIIALEKEITNTSVPPVSVKSIKSTGF